VLPDAKVQEETMYVPGTDGAKGNYGYGHAKQALYEVILNKFEEPREKFEYYMNNLNEIDDALALGAEKAKKVADGVLDRVREKLGY